MSTENIGGTTFGQYELREMIGSGGMGSVYLAYQPGLRRKVAIKVLNSASISDPNYLERFAREAQMAASLEHPHIVPVYDHGVTAEGISYVVMRLLTGGSLGQRLEQLKAKGESLPTLSETATLLRQMANALDYAHDKGVIHRDIKPNNIMFDEQGNSYLVDFGIARAAAEAGSSTLTTTGMMVGTPAYMPPEVWRGDQWAKSSDQYALGIVIYEMVSGTTPFLAPTLYEVIHKHLHDIPELPANLRDEVPETIIPVLQRALSKSPEDRYASMTAFSQDFDEAIKLAGIADTTQSTGFFMMPIEGQPKFVTTPRNLVLGTSAFSTLQLNRTPTELLPAPMSRNRRMAMGAVAAVIVLALAVLVLMTVQGNTQSTNLQATLSALEATNAANPALLTGDVLTATADACIATYAPSNTGGTGEIAFYSTRSGNKNIYLMNADGSNVRALTDTNADDTNPIWSLDGSKIAFISTRDGNDEIYLLVSAPDDRESFSTQRLTDNVGADGEPAWSPDGTQIAFASQDGANWDIYVINVDGSGLKRLTDHVANDITPAWSPDGKQIAFNSTRDGNQEVYIMDANGGNLRRITDSEANDGYSIGWSPDGSKLAFVSIQPDGNWEIYVKDMAADSEPVDITNLTGDEWQFAWSRDSQTITFLWQTDNVEILVVNPDGSNRRNITGSSSDDYAYSWSPDGQHIAFETDRNGDWELYSANLCGGDVRRLTNNSADDDYPAWRPSG